jgi:hypothetical protein
VCLSVAFWGQLIFSIGELPPVEWMSIDILGQRVSRVTRKINDLRECWTISDVPDVEVVARDGIEPPTPAFSGPPTDERQAV